jgi:hypothetical protein
MTISSVKTGAIGDSLLAGNPSFIPTSFESIATATGTGSSGTITFSSIPATYQHLQLRILARGSAASAGADLWFRLNSDTATNYAQHTLMGDGSAASAAGIANSTSMYANVAGSSIPAASATASAMGTIIVDIHDYVSTTKNKTLRTFGGFDVNGTGGRIYLSSGLWRSTTAVNAITVNLDSGNFTTSSVVSLYGIKG